MWKKNNLLFLNIISIFFFSRFLTVATMEIKEVYCTFGFLYLCILIFFISPLQVSQELYMAYAPQGSEKGSSQVSHRFHRRDSSFPLRPSFRPSVSLSHFSFPHSFYLFVWEINKHMQLAKKPQNVKQQIKFTVL